MTADHPKMRPTDWENTLSAELASANRPSGNGVWVVATCRNELTRLPAFLEHHRQIGISGFVIIDNGSNDGSREYLEQQEDVRCISLLAPFQEFKGEFRSIICDSWFQDRWVLFLDCDELLFFPDQENRSIFEFLEACTSRGHDAVLGMMVDAYPEPSRFGKDFNSKLSKIFFDGEGYWASCVTNRSSQKWQTPNFNLFGGASTRLFFSSDGVTNSRYWLSLMKVSLNFVGSPIVRTGLSKKLQKAVSNRLRFLQRFTEVTPPKQNKIALLRWRKGTKFQSSAHRVNFHYQTASVRVCLIHLKFFGEFHQNVREIASSGSHANGSEVYKQMLRELSHSDSWSNRLHWRHTVELTSSSTLKKSGLFGSRASVSTLYKA